MSGWHHSPIHLFPESGAYMVTAGTYRRLHHFSSPERLSLLHDLLLQLTQECGWQLQAWAVMSNHYHWVGISDQAPENLPEMVRSLHWQTAVAINEMDGTPGRKIWFNYWDKHITFERSYLARLNYVHYNVQKHGICDVAERYPWCSAGWFETNAEPGFIRTVRGFKTDLLKEQDPY